MLLLVCPDEFITYSVYVPGVMNGTVKVIAPLLNEFPVTKLKLPLLPESVTVMFDVKFEPKMVMVEPRDALFEESDEMLGPKVFELKLLPNTETCMVEYANAPLLSVAVKRTV